MSGMYLRRTQRKNRDGTVVAYLQLAVSRRVDGGTRAEVVANLGREDQLDAQALRQLAASIGRYLGDGGESAGAGAATGIGDAIVSGALGSGIPAGADAFIGRERETAELRGRILGERGAEGTAGAAGRLVTVVGPAGVGKTRLAAEAARQVRESFHGAVWWVDLATVAAGAGLDELVAVLAGTDGEPGREDRELVAGAIGRGPGLLVLDTCEHVVEGCARLVPWLLAVCPRLRVLVTSREHLGIAGEGLFSVDPLGTHESGARELTALRESAAVRLFVARARAVATGFELTDDLVPIVGGLCARLDGLPLAVELAARQLRFLTAAQVAERLADGPAVLSGGARDAAPRHRSLTAAIGWSYELLDKREQGLFRRLCVFPDGFDEDGAGALGADLGLTGDELWLLLRALIDKSLLSSVAPGVPVAPVAPVVPGVRAAARFRILGPMRMFGYDLLSTAGELAAAHERLLAWAADLADCLISEPMIPHGYWLRLDAERNTLRWAAHLAGQAADRRFPLLATVSATAAFRRGQIDESQALLARVLAAPAEDSPVRALALGAYATTLTLRGDYPSALEYAEQSLATARHLDHPILENRALVELAFVRNRLGDCAAAVTVDRERVAALRGRGHPLALAEALASLAWNLLTGDHAEEAAAPIEEALELLATRPDATVCGPALHTAGAIAVARAQYASARDYFTLALRTDAVEPDLVPYNVDGLALVAAADGRPQRALRLFAAAAAARTRAGLAVDPWWAARCEQAAVGARGRLGRSRADATVSRGTAMTAQQAVAYALADRPSADRAGDPAGVLTARERQVAELVARGLTNPGIAERLGVSPRTVVSHLEHIRAKLGLPGRVQIAVWAARVGAVGED